MLKLNLSEAAEDNIVHIDIRRHPVVAEVDKIIKNAGFNGIEVAVFSNSYTNVNGGQPDIFIDIDAYSHLNLYCLDYNTRLSQFELRSTHYNNSVTFGPNDTGAEELSTDLYKLFNLVNRLSEIDFKKLKADLIKEYIK